MSPSAEGAIAPRDNFSNAVHAARVLHSRRNRHVLTHFRGQLGTASSVLQTHAMLCHLEELAARDGLAKEERGGLQVEVARKRERLLMGLQSFDYAHNDALYSEVEALVLRHDAAFLETLHAVPDMQRDSARLQQPKPTWTSNPSRKMLTLLKRDFDADPVAAEKEHQYCISKCSWAVALTGLFVALSFLVVDYVAAQTNPAVSTSILRHEYQQLPNIFACLNVPYIPLFHQYPTSTYPGYPLWGFRSFRNADTNDTYMHPNTTHIIGEPTFLGDPEACQSSLTAMSAPRIMQAITSNLPFRHKCHSCIRIGRKKPINVTYSSVQSRQTGAIFTEFAVAKELMYCLDPSRFIDGNVYAEIWKVIAKEELRLVEQNIIVIVNPDMYPFRLIRALAFLASHTSALEMKQSLSLRRSVFCNLYLLSGIFFPVNNQSRVRYQIHVTSATTHRWQQVGDATNFLYYDDDSYVTGNYVLNESSILQQMRFESNKNDKLLSNHLIDIYVLNSDKRVMPAFEEFAASLEPFRQNMLLLSTSSVDGVVEYQTRLLEGPSRIFVVPQRFMRFFVSFDFESFETEVIVRRPTTSTSEFLADVFEYIGLFTGVCAYSLIVGPARMYLKKRRADNRR